MYLEINCICESDSPRIFLFRYVRALLENMSLLCHHYIIKNIKVHSGYYLDIYIYKHYEYISFSLVIVMEMGCRLSVGCAIYRNYIIV